MLCDVPCVCQIHVFKFRYFFISRTRFWWLMAEHLTSSDQPDTIKLNKLVSSFRVCRTTCHMTFLYILCSCNRDKSKLLEIHTCKFNYHISLNRILSFICFLPLIVSLFCEEIIHISLMKMHKPLNIFPILRPRKI